MPAARNISKAPALHSSCLYNILLLRVDTSYNFRKDMEKKANKKHTVPKTTRVVDKKRETTAIYHNQTLLVSRLKSSTDTQKPK
jgi:hypothetical protein